jgi:hypothetical protein
MTETKRGGGPKTQQGKARSSMNAKTHGITSSKPKDENEKALIEAFSKELVDYYDPQSPLEKPIEVTFLDFSWHLRTPEEPFYSSKKGDKFNLKGA